MIFYKQSIFPSFSSEFLTKESKNKHKNSTRIYAQVLERQYIIFYTHHFKDQKQKPTHSL